tara:strand:+ start:850 stop:1449 length:600 start_codon:yes stop_codon:yes gene_type:complete
MNKRKRCNDDSVEKDENKSPLIRLEKNRVYFYDEVSKNSVLELQKVVNMAREYAIIHRDICSIDLPSVYIFINSDGGCVYSGLAALDFLQSIKDVTIITIVEGCAASASTFLLLGGSKRFIRKHATVLIHQITANYWGDVEFERLRDEFKNTEKLMDIINKVYKDNTSISQRKLSTLFTREQYMDAAEAIRFQICHDYL